MTDWTPPDDAKEESEQTFTLAPRDTEQNAPCAGKYLREHSIPILIALVIGAALGALLIPCQRKEPDAVQTVRDWLEKTLEEFFKQWPKAKKQAHSIQENLVEKAQDLGKTLPFWCR